MTELKAYVADRTVNGDRNKISSEEKGVLEDLAHKLHEYVFSASEQDKRGVMKKRPLFLGYEVPWGEEKSKTIIVCPLYKKDKIVAVHFDKKSLENISDIIVGKGVETLWFEYNNTKIQLRYEKDFSVEKYLQNEGIKEK